MFKNKGTRVIETERLVLRKFQEDDAIQMYNNWANDERVTRYLRWLPHKDEDMTKGLCKTWEDSYRKEDMYHWAIVEKDSRNVIGSIGLVDTNEDMLFGELGFCIGYNWWGKGLVAEAVKAVLEYIDDIGFVRLCAIHDVLNENSGKVLMKCGFEYEGTLKKYDKNNKGQFADVKMYSITK